MKILLLVLLLVLSSCMVTTPVRQGPPKLTTEQIIDKCVEKYVDKYIDIARAIEACERIYRPVRK